MITGADNIYRMDFSQMVESPLESGFPLTIEGIRHRSGVWNGDPVSAEQPVAFTIFIACPAEDPCYVLRLSQLNNPLR